eukprot:CAMPEP_0204116812 /NCGR_PEP_ID=MMETSP0361-20130328/5630_1 /ASSEMBLY_ACC=CAM_ASM_000343 /TAXON_ID=268821 /ORGANISM="Scrippsiella Hangoei, Strain SHTV-5" /LENGTH=172 /DNA_ID=CAMNT_0051067663 /DNA_START=53 /DNA_END=567 /DNA_ORIENTATION=+
MSGTSSSSTSESEASESEEATSAPAASFTCKHFPSTFLFSTSKGFDPVAAVFRKPSARLPAAACGPASTLPIPMPPATRVSLETCALRRAGIFCCCCCLSASSLRSSNSCRLLSATSSASVFAPFPAARGLMRSSSGSSSGAEIRNLPRFNEVDVDVDGLESPPARSVVCGR